MKDIPALASRLAESARCSKTKSPVAPREIQPLLQSFGIRLLECVEFLLNLRVFLFEILLLMIASFER